MIKAIQQYVARWRPREPEVNDHRQLVVGPQKFEECKEALSDALSSLPRKAYEGFYKYRADGRHLHQFMNISGERAEVAVISHWPQKL